MKVTLLAGLWTTVMLVVLLSAGHEAAVNKNKLAELIRRIKNQYKTSGMFSLAVSIPGGDENNLNQVFQESPNNQVQAVISTGAVYRGNRLALARVEQPEHAELRVLKNLNLFNRKGDLLVIYSYASSCPTTCTNIKSPFNIIKEINKVIDEGRWTKYAFVFETIFKPRNSNGIDEKLLIKALRELGKSRISLENIFRCFKPVNRNFQCISCSSGGKVTKDCFDYNALY